MGKKYIATQAVQNDINSKILKLNNKMNLMANALKVSYEEQLEYWNVDKKVLQLYHVSNTDYRHTNYIDVITNNTDTLTASIDNTEDFSITVGHDSVIVTVIPKPVMNGTQTTDVYYIESSATLTITQGIHTASIPVTMSLTKPIAPPSATIFTLSEIKDALNKGIAQHTYRIGDCMRIDLPSTATTSGYGTIQHDGSLGGTYYASIIGFNHNKDFETDGKDSVHFIIGKNENFQDIALNICLTTGQNTGQGYAKSRIKTQILPRIFSYLPTDLQNEIATIRKSECVHNGTNSADVTIDNNTKLFLLSEFEVMGTNAYSSNKYENLTQEQYEYYKAGNSLVRKIYASTSTASDKYISNQWMLRSNYINHGIAIDVYGRLVADQWNGVIAPAFVITADH